jgi:hypothetical protein
MNYEERTKERKRIILEIDGVELEMKGLERKIEEKNK